MVHVVSDMPTWWTLSSHGRMVQVCSFHEGFSDCCSNYIIFFHSQHNFVPFSETIRSVQLLVAHVSAQH